MTKAVRFLALGAVVSLSALLGAVQISSMAVYGDLASGRSLPAYIRSLGLSRVPIVGDLRVKATAAVHNGDGTSASALLALLPEDAESEDLRGRLFASAGWPDEAIAHFIRAADGTRTQALIDELDPSRKAGIPSAERRARLLRALAFQRRLVAVLAGDPQALDTGGYAWLRLGQLERAVGTIDPARRRSLYDEAQQSYLRALASAPNDATYLLGAANQTLLEAATFGTDPRPAETWLRRVLEVVPNSTDAYAGLAQAAALRGDCVAARDLRERWRSWHAPRDRDPVDEPELAPALRRCLGMARN